jgi:hypothetical protein
MGGVQELDKNHFYADNILCAEGTIEQALQLSKNEEKRYSPLTVQSQPNGGIHLDHSNLLFRFDDPEYNVIYHFFSADKKSIIFSGEKDSLVSLPHHHLLNLPGTLEDAQYRQDAVRELVENKPLYEALEQILHSSDLFYPTPYVNSPRQNTTLSFDTNPKRAAQFIDDICSLSEYNPQSSSLKSLLEWAEGFKDDTILHELLKKKRSITDSRLFIAFSYLHGGVKYGLLKPDVNPADVFDFLAPELTEHVEEITSRSGKTTKKFRSIVKYKDPLDQSTVESIVAQARQRMDILNEISAKMLAMPTFLMQLQMKHLYQGAYLHHKLTEKCFPMTFPEFSDDDSIEIDELYPLRMVLQGEHSPNDLAVNSLKFSSDQRVIQVEGPNGNGKTEAWRTLHLLKVLANSGYPVPASSVKMGVVPNSYFISCKGDSGLGGSELKHSIVRGVFEKYKTVFNGSTVILDELGDSTNAPTARLLAKRLIPPLLKRGCRVFVTSHHDALTDYISKELGGVSLMPQHTDDPLKKYILVPKIGEVDFKAEKTLDNMGITDDVVNSLFPDERRTSVLIGEPETDDSYDDGPF